jgi:hypothetical protein
MFGNKGATEWMEVLTIICVSALVVMLAFMVPKMIEDMASLFALGSAEAVARDLAGLITISGAAFDDASISYVGADERIAYDVNITARLVSVQAFRVTGGAGARVLEPIGGIEAMEHGYGKIPFDVEASVKGENDFDITKSAPGYDIQVE